MPLRILSSVAILACAAGCQHPASAPPPVSSVPPTLTSSPVPPPEHPRPPPPPRRDEQVWRFDFVLTPKDPKDATVTPTSFSVNVLENRTGEVMIGRNVPLASAAPAAAGTAPPHGVPRQDVGLKVKTHVEPLAGDSLLLDVELELSAVESGGPASSIRKVTTHGAAVAAPGKSALVVSLEDDKRHYELTVTPTKLH